MARHWPSCSTMCGGRRRRSCRGILGATCGTSLRRLTRRHSRRMACRRSNRRRRAPRHARCFRYPTGLCRPCRMMWRPRRERHWRSGRGRGMTRISENRALITTRPGIGNEPMANSVYNTNRPHDVWWSTIILKRVVIHHAHCQWDSGVSGFGFEHGSALRPSLTMAGWHGRGFADMGARSYVRTQQMQGAWCAGGTLCREWSDAMRCSENDGDRQ